MITLTANLLAEFTTDYADEVRLGATQRASAMSFQVGGKGINVAKMAARLGAQVTALGFSGGIFAQPIESWLAAQPWSTQLFPLEGESRGGWVVRTPTGEETTFLGVDAPLPLARWEEALAWIAAQSPMWLAVCGSIPGWSAAHAAVWRNFAVGWRRQGGQIAIDSYGVPLADLCAVEPDLLKVNREEWKAAMAGETPPPAARMTIISDGGGPVEWREANGDGWWVNPPVVNELSPTGSGDTLLAALLVARSHGLSWVQALERALPYASANAADAGVAAFPLDGLPSLRA